MARPAPDLRPLAAFVILYMLGFGAMALRGGNTEFLVYTASMVVFIAAALLIHRRVGFSPLALWLLALWGAMHMAGGTVPIPDHLAQTDSARSVLYSLRPWPDLPRYDQLTHAFGFFAATLACYEAVVAAASGGAAAPGHSRPDLRPAPRSLSAAAALMGIGLGAINEVLEFVVTLLVPEHNVGGYTNTGWDLVANAIGATAAALLTATVWRR